MRTRATAVASAVTRRLEDASGEAAVIAPAYGFVKSILPRVSRTEQEALDAGTVGWDAELFSGRTNLTWLRSAHAYKTGFYFEQSRNADTRR